MIWQHAFAASMFALNGLIWMFIPSEYYGKEAKMMLVAGWFTAAVIMVVYNV